MLKYILFIWVSLAIVPLSAFGQDENALSKKEQKALVKEERKARKAAEQEQLRNLTRWMVEQNRFVMEADYVSDNRGTRRPVNSTINFIAVDSTEGVIQLSTLWGPGYNGVGGITVEGRISSYKVDTIQSKSGNSYNITIMLNTSMGTFDIFFSVTPTGFADATIRGNTRGSLRYTGNLVPIEVSRVYKGTTSY
jgi:hypothetical protein